jgi:hypothetical protein
MTFAIRAAATGHGCTSLAEPGPMAYLWPLILRRQQEIERMRHQPACLAMLLGSLWVVAACTGSGPAQTRRDLDTRMAVGLTPDIAAGRATLRQSADGISVTLADQKLFAAGGNDLNDAGQQVLTRVIQALLDPALMRIAVAGPATTPAARVLAVTRVFKDAGLGPSLRTTAPTQPIPSASGLTIAVSVVAG